MERFWNRLLRVSAHCGVSRSPSGLAKDSPEVSRTPDRANTASVDRFMAIPSLLPGVGYQSILLLSPTYTDRMNAMTFQISSSVSWAPTLGMVALEISPLMSLYRTSSLLPNFHTSSVSGGPMPPPPPTPWQAEHPYLR